MNPFFQLNIDLILNQKKTTKGSEVNWEVYIIWMFRRKEEKKGTNFRLQSFKKRS